MHHSSYLSLTKNASYPVEEDFYRDGVGSCVVQACIETCREEEWGWGGS